MDTDYDRLKAWFAELGPCLVAYSGGVDSSLLLAAAHDALGEATLAVTAASPLHPATETAEAKALAVRLGARHVSVELDELAHPLVRANPPDRCYHCKRLRFEALLALAQDEGLAAVVDGSNADDLGDYRPGLKAKQELGVRSPLMELSIGKAAIRRMAKQRGLPTWDRPAAACLASRIPYGRSLSRDKLARVAEAEAALAALGLGQYRVRDHGSVARIELTDDKLAEALADPLRTRLLEAVRAAGYDYVAVDLAGYRTGSLNEVLPEDG